MADIADTDQGGSYTEFSSSDSGSWRQQLRLQIAKETTVSLSVYPVRPAL